MFGSFDLAFFFASCGEAGGTCWTAKGTRAATGGPVTDKSTISTEISLVVGENFIAWRIGLTNDPTWRKKHWKHNHKQDVSRWQQWQVDSLSDAKAIERSLMNNGMKGALEPEINDVVSDEFPIYLYIF